MKTIFMVCRSRDELPKSLLSLMKVVFPECDIKVVCSGATSSFDLAGPEQRFLNHFLKDKEAPLIKRRMRRVKSKGGEKIARGNLGATSE